MERIRLKVFENGLLMIIFGSRSYKIIRGWRRLRNEELHKFCLSPNIIRMIRSKKIKWAGQVARFGR
jgi:hypothetical protein